MKTVLILMDTLRRDMLSCYNPESGVITPNLDAFAQESAIFDNHWIGSAPCMPARRDIMTGRLNFLERPWGPIEPFDITLPQCLRSKGIFTHITTDHCHYLRTGGEGYLQEFNTWDYYRGQEGDPWVSRIDEPSNMPESFYGRVREQYQKNRKLWPQEADMPSPKTFQSAIDWIADNKDNDDYFLMVEAFDPHEPFDVPETYMDLYGGNEGLDRQYFEIPQYKRVSDTDVTPEAVDYIQRRYKALVTMTDVWFGKLINAMKSSGTFEDTLILVTTDHGYFLGERDYMGKNYMHLYNELAHLPFLVHFPGGVCAQQRFEQLTQAIDIMPTVLEANNCEIPSIVQGTSLYKLMSEPKAPTHEYVLYGVHGMTVNICDGRYTYLRAPVSTNQPCYEYAAIPLTIRKKMGLDCIDEIEMGQFLPWTKYPVYKFPSKKPANIESETPLAEIGETQLFDLQRDYEQTQNLAGEDLPTEKYIIDLLLRGLEEFEAPAEQRVRLGL